MKITVVGTGYVGLVSGAGFADFGHEVVCVDKDRSKIEALIAGQMPIYEPGLEEMVEKNRRAGRLSFTTNMEKAISGSQVIFIAVGTPASRRGDGYADLTYVYEVAREIAPFLNDYKVIVIKSTVPVGTGRQVARIIKETNPGAQFDMASNPEFLREGEALEDFMKPNRVVIGVDNSRAEEILREVYRPLFLAEIPFVMMSIESAELTKYASNAFLATKISFINEISALCEETGANVLDVAQGMGLDTRIGRSFLQAGPGYGGSCFPKDTRALLRMAQEYGVALRIVEAVVEVNEAQKARMVRKIRQALGGSEAGKTLAVLGLTFKPDTDDMREAPSLTILPALIERGATIRAHDPQGMKEAKKLLPDLIYCSSPYDACDGSDALVLMTEWREYRALDFYKLKKLLREPIFIDLRNVYRRKQMEEAGFIYHSVGRKPVIPSETYSLKVCR